MDSWEFDGGFLASIDLASGLIKSSHLLRARHIENYMLDSEGNFQVTSGSETLTLDPMSLLKLEETNGSGPQFSDRPLTEVAPYLIESLMGSDLEDAERATLQLQEVIKSTALSTELLEFDPAEMNPPFGTSGSNTDYECALGGFMNVELRAAFSNIGTGTEKTSDNSYQFEECRFTVTDGSLQDGKYSVEGTLNTRSLERSARGSVNEYSRRWSAITIDGPSSTRTEIEGGTEYQKLNAAGTFIDRTFKTDIPLYRYIVDGVIVKSIMDANTELLDFSTSSTPISFSREFSGVVSGIGTSGHTITLTTNSHLFSAWNYNGVSPFTGQIQALSSNGDELTISPVGNSVERHDLSVEYHLQNGNSQTSQAISSINKPLLSLLYPFSISGESLSPVTGLRAEIYSETAAEIFWDRMPEVNVQYRV